MTTDRDQPERPRTEPEIIPPDRAGRSEWHRSPWRDEAPWRDDRFAQARGTQRIYVGRLGPFGVALLVLAIVAIVSIIVIAALGALLIWLPIVAALVVGGALFRLLRR